MGLRGSARQARFKRDTIRSEGPLILVCDTSSNYLSVGLQRGPNLLSAHTAYQPLSHARALLPAVDLVLSEHGLTLADLSAFGVCLGPGSFTGLRVALTTVKALGFDRSLPGIGIPTIDVLAAAAGSSTPVGCLIDARKNEAYSALFSAPDDQGQRTLLLPTKAGSPEAGIARLLETARSPMTLVGSGCLSAPAELLDNPGIIVPLPRWHLPDLRTLAELCMARFLAGETQPLDHLEPVYVGLPPIHKHRG